MYNCIDIRLWNIRVQAIKENNSTSTFTKVMIPLLYHRRRLHLCEYTYHKYRIKNVALHTEFHFRCILLIPFFSYFLRLIFHGSKNVCWIKKIRMLHIYIQVRHVPYGARPGFIVCLYNDTYNCIFYIHRRHIVGLFSYTDVSTWTKYSRKGRKSTNKIQDAKNHFKFGFWGLK